ncbi:MAG: AAA family ATPase [Candidatus Ventricola sp.]|nr:AAA family ATPase [Candidatus Ventricola sp.]
MRISRVIISNYRNLKNVDVRIESLVTLIGENNSGKSNFLKAITLPFLSDDTGTSKQLSWYDINDDAKSSFYEYVSSKRKEIVKGTADLDELSSQIPKVIVKVELEAADTEHYDLKDLYAEERDGQLIASIQYCYCVDKKQQFFERIRELLSSDLPVEDMKMSLLPIEMFIYSITIPGKDCKVPY